MTTIIWEEPDRRFRVNVRTPEKQETRFCAIWNLTQAGYVTDYAVAVAILNPGKPVDGKLQRC